MAFKKITRNVENIQTLPDKPYLDAQVLKAEFDKGNKIIKEDFNELSGELDQYSSYVNSAYSPKARKNIVVGDELQNETLYFDFSSLTYSDMHSDAYLIYVDDNHYIKTTLKSETEAGIILKDGNIFKTLFTITNEDVISVNQTYYTFSSSCGNVVEVNSSYIEYTKCYINDEDKTLTNLANIQSIGNNLTLSNSGRLDATGGGSGTTDYSDLTNKPSINSVTLSGNKTSSDLSLQDKIDSNNKLNYQYLSNTPTIPTNSDFTLNGLSEKSYTNLTDKPTIPTKTSDLTNDSSFITNSDIPIYYWDRTKNDASKALFTSLVTKYRNNEPFILIAKYLDTGSYMKVSNLCVLAFSENINGDAYVYEITARDSLTHIRHNLYVDNYTVTSITLNSTTISGATESWTNTWFLNKYNTSSYTPSGNYNPATKKYVDDGLANKQDSLVSGTNIKTINNESILGSGNITVGGGGTATDVQINGTSIVSSNTANILTEGTYNSTSNKIATMSDLPTNSGIVDLIYPVGSIYMSVNSTSPATLFGGTWQQIEDRFLLSAGSTYTAGATGGEATHTLTVDEIPSHNHGLYSRNAYQSGTTGAINGWNTGGTSYNTKNTGGGEAHNNMPPYLVVYMWQRTA